jgi:hypothetical protein
MYSGPIVLGRQIERILQSGLQWCSKAAAVIPEIKVVYQIVLRMIRQRRKLETEAESLGE